MNDERKKILKMIEDGIISSEEAEELLDSIDKAEQAQDANEEHYPNEISTQVNWEEGTGQSKKAFQSKKSTFLNFVEDAFHKIKNVDLDFNFGNFYKVSHIFHNQSSNFSKIDIDVSNGSIYLLPWSENDVRLECEAKVYQVETQGEAREKFLDESEFEIEEDALRFYLPSKRMKTQLTIYVPEKVYQKVSLKLFNGNISAKKLTMGRLRGKTSNGTVKVSDSEGKKWNLETTNGSIKIEKSNCDDFEAETVNGSVHIDGAYKKIDAAAVSGSIHCDWQGLEAHTGFFKTTTGSIRLSLPETKVDGKLETKMGSIHCDMDDYKIFDETKDMMRKSLHFEANEHYQNALHMEAETKTGSIWIVPGKKEE